MTASDTALSGSAPPDPDSGDQAGDRGSLEAASIDRNGHRAESYRQLWQPPGRRPSHRQALGQPYVWAGPEQPALTGGPAEPLAAPTLATADTRPPAATGRAPTRPAGRPIRRDRPADRPIPRAELEYRRPRHAYPLAEAAAPAERAVIGDLLRVPIAWCQSGTCIAWHADPAALGEADVRARAVAAGWCVDAFGRVVCPDCQQRYYVWSARPLVPRTGRPPARDSRAPRPARAAGRHRRPY